MILKNLIRIIPRRIINKSYSFSNSIQQIYKHAQLLNKLDTLKLDELCQIFRNNYLQKSNNQLIEQFNKIIKQNSQQIFKSLSIIYQNFNKINIGLLRGDIHAQGLFEIQKYISKKITQSIKVKTLQIQDYKNILNLITDYKQLRLPKKGIKFRNLQTKKNLYQRQLLLESVTTQHAYDQYFKMLNNLKQINSIHLLETLRRPILQWIPSVTKTIKNQQLKCKQGQLTQKRKIYSQYLLALPAQKIATLALNQLMRFITRILFQVGDQDSNQNYSSDGIPTKILGNNIANIIAAQIKYQKQQLRFKQIQRQYDQILKKRQIKDKLDLDKFKMLDQLKLQYRYIKPQNRKNYLKQLSGKLTKSRIKWLENDTMIYLGEVIVYILKQVLYIKNKYGFRVPLLLPQHRFIKRNQKCLSSSLLKVNQYFVSTILPTLEKEGDMSLHLQRSLPTIIQPLPWVEFEIGGYYIQSTVVMRFSQTEDQKKAVKFADLSRVYNVLNYLGNTPWRINKKILGLVETLWDQGGNYGEIPKRYSQLITSLKSKYKNETDYKTQLALNRKIQQIRDQNSLRCSFLLKLNIAKSFSKLDYFYFPHNLDFRGRVYPVPPQFNHIGSDIARGLLEFGVGKPLGKHGLKWLKIHCANLMGKEKAIIPQKIKFIQENENKIKTIAENPLEYREWLQFEDCWQAIAAIIQLDSALKSPNPQEYISYIHIHQDGSCNGLQHYAALGRDLQGAMSVNLGQLDHPSDVYSHVAGMVNNQIQQDLNNPDHKYYLVVKKLHKNIKRKTIKQTVMTSVYGVTFIGARQQIYKQIKSTVFDKQSEAYLASIYLAKITLQAISSLFRGAHLIKQWLLKSAKIISSTGNPVSWITPMGLPVIQPYRNISSLDRIQTISRSLTIPIHKKYLTINKSKQQSAFPPNFIHSLDSTHMMYTAQQCQKKGFVFAAVHDSYWCHAGHITICQFTSITIIIEFKKSFQIRFPGLKFPQIPHRGQFDLKNVQKSLYFFA